MKLEDAKAIVTAANDLGYEVDLREEYSGRGMYGRVTAAVTGDRDEIIESAERAGVSLAGRSWDSMGIGRVMY